MRTVLVYRWKTWNQQAGDYDISRRMATREAIERIKKLVILEGTATEVDSLLLNEEGMTEFDFIP